MKSWARSSSSVTGVGFPFVNENTLEQHEMTKRLSTKNRIDFELVVISWEG